MMAAAIDDSPDLWAACERFLAELADAPALEGHDQGTFTISWAPLIEARGCQPALDLARAYFALARQAYPHGRRHGCSARSVSAIARGHGRNNNAGAVTAVLAPLLAGFGGR